MLPCHTKYILRAGFAIVPVTVMRYVIHILEIKHLKGITANVLYKLTRIHYMKAVY